MTEMPKPTPNDRRFTIRGIQRKYRRDGLPVPTDAECRGALNLLRESGNQAQNGLTIGEWNEAIRAFRKGRRRG